jgi:hypothetical protein
MKKPEPDVGTAAVTSPATDVNVDAPPPPCLHPEHRLGTHGRLKSNQRVCLNCGEVVLVRRRKP